MAVNVPIIEAATPPPLASGLDVPPGWKQMSSGKGIDLARPSAAAVDWNDIATSLALTCRFNGATRGPDVFYSNAQHSCLVADLLHPKLAPYGLLHDAHEAYVGDQITPLKRLLAAEHPDAAEWLAGIKHSWDHAIWEAARLPAPNADILDAVKQADTMALAIERLNVLADPADAMTVAAWARLPDATGFTIQPMGPQAAHALFISYLDQLIWPTTVEAGHA